MAARNKRESKEDRFERIAVRRTGEVLRKLKLLGNLSNRNNYAYSEDQVREMFGAIDRELKGARERFTATGRGDPVFRFSRPR